MNKLQNQILKNKSLDIFLLIIVLSSICLLPDVTISTLPKIQLIDFILPLIVTMLVYKKVVTNNKFYLILFVYVVVILLSILINNRLKSIPDYFEIYKIIKLSIIIFFVSNIQSLNYFSKAIKVIFYVLVVLNLMHYFDIFEFNSKVEWLYSPEHHLNSFGLNSIGQPDTKRLLGTLGNPNNNALLFLFFIIFFLPKKELHYKLNINFFICLILLFACQSRTSVIALIVLIIIYFILNKSIGIINIGKVLFVITFSFFVVSNLVYLDIYFSKMKNKLISNKSIEDKTKPEINSIVKDTVFSVVKLTNKDTNVELKKSEPKNSIKTTDSSSTITKPITKLENTKIVKNKVTHENSDGTKYIGSIVDASVLESGSVKGRITVWKQLWFMIKEKPILGHGPYKEYFYNNQLYSENELILITWRYGLIGLIIHLSLFVFLLYKSFVNRHYYYAEVCFYFTTIIFIASLTNNPISEPRISILFAIVIGLFFNQLNFNSKNEKEIIAHR